MLAQEVPMEDVDRILYGEKEKSDSVESNYSTPNNSNQEQPEQRLLRQRGLKEFTLEKRPYYKRPVVQIGFVLLVGFPMTWFLLSIFNPGSNVQPEKAEADPLEQENEQLKSSLNKARQQIDDMNFSEALEAQSLELVKPVSAEPEPAPAPAPQKVAQPSRPVAQPVVYRQPQTVPVVQVQPAVVEPEVDPYEQWLAQAKRGYSASSLEKIPARPVVAAASGQPNPVSSTEEVPEVLSSPENSQAAVVPDSSATATATARVLTKNQTLFDDSRWRAVRNGKTLGNNAYLRSRFDRGRELLSNQAQLVGTRHNSESGVNSSTARGEELGTVGVVQNPVTPKVPEPNKLLDIGAYAEATLADGIAWTEASNRNRKYILYLEEGFENSGGIQVLPKGTRLIAQVTQVDRSGLFLMEVIEIVFDFNQPKLSVPAGTLEIVAEDGSPLKAKIKQKRGDDFWSNAGAIIAPGIEKALDNTDSLLVNDGDRSIIRANGNDNPLASGISGVAEGASTVFTERMRRARNQSVVSYFEFEGERTVRIRVNEDFLLP